MTVKQEFQVNEHLSLRLEDTNPNSYDDWTVIYVDGEKFIQCHFLLINISHENVNSLNKMDSIDEVEASLNKKHERNPTLLSAEEEFLGHCSNLQAWAEHGYDTRLLHRNLAFPLLKKLTEVGDFEAKKVFKEEIVKRLLSGAESVIQYLIIEGYVDYFTEEEWTMLIWDFSVEPKEMVEKHIIKVLKTVGTAHERKEKLFSFLKLINNDKASLLEHVQFNGERFFINDGDLKTYITKDKKRKIENITDIIGLDKLKDLRRLDLSNHNIKKIESLENLHKLQILDISVNRITEMTGLDKLYSLKELILELNQIQEIKGVENAQKLEVLNLNDNQIKDLKGLENLFNLRQLLLRGNKITEIKGLNNLKNLENLHLSNNKIRKINNIDNLKNLQKIHLIGNPIPDSEINSIKDKKIKIFYSF